MKKGVEAAAHLHEKVPPDWYFSSIRKNIFQSFWHKRRFREVSKLIEEGSEKILDIGSADGVFTKVILDKSKATEIIGIDVLKKSVDWANKHWKNYPQIRFYLGDAHKLEFPKDTFDVVFALEVLEHVYKPKVVLQEVKRVLKKHGYAVFLVPSDSILFKIIWFVWTKFRGKIWDHTHIQTYRNDYLTRLCKKAGFRIEKNAKFLLGMLQAVKIRKK